MSEILPALRIARHVDYCRVEGDYVLMDVKRNRYYALDPVASRIWAILAGGGQLDDAVQDLLAHYRVEEERARRDVAALLTDLRSKGLLEERTD